MRPPDEVRRDLARLWFAKADEDLAAARCLSDARPPLWSTVGFHCQQAVEKYLKAVLTWHQIEFRKTHDLTELLDLVAKVAPGPAAAHRDCAILSDYGVLVRYPVGLPDLTPEEARAAITVAEKIRAAFSLPN